MSSSNVFGLLLDALNKRDVRVSCKWFRYFVYSTKMLVILKNKRDFLEMSKEDRIKLLFFIRTEETAANRKVGTCRDKSGREFGQKDERKMEKDEENRETRKSRKEKDHK